MANKQEVITQADAELEIAERKAMGLERRTQDRHNLRMEWYRNRTIRTVGTVAVAAGSFAAVTFVASHFDFWTAIIAMVSAGGCVVTFAIINATAQPPEER